MLTPRSPYRTWRQRTYVAKQCISALFLSVKPFTLLPVVYHPHLLPRRPSSKLSQAIMSKNEFNSLLRRSVSGDKSAPWWVNWLTQIAVLAALATAVAFGIDWLWVHLLGRPAFAVCGLVSFIPLGMLLQIGVIVGIAGALVLMLARAPKQGLTIIAIGAVLYLAPNTLLSMGYGGSCKVPGTVSAPAQN